MTAVATASPLAREIAASFTNSLKASQRKSEPYRYWLLEKVLPSSVARELYALPLSPPEGLVFSGRRETNNASRTYFGEENRRRFAVGDALARAFQAKETVAAIEEECGTSLVGTSLRLEFCQDVEGFWLEPHTDIGVKRFTMSLYLCKGQNAADLGTDIYDANRNWVGSAPSGFNTAMIFIPSNTTFHGFRERPIPGVRKSIIINYVTQEWRNRHELAFPETPVG